MKLYVGINKIGKRWTFLETKQTSNGKSEFFFHFLIELPKLNGPILSDALLWKAYTAFLKQLSAGQLFEQCNAGP
jgi:hypothetical protein